MPHTSISLWRRYQADEPQAAEQLFRRYVARLTALASRRLSPKLAARIGAEDVVQSAYRSFFVGAKAGRFSIQASGDLWRLLATMTVHKLQGQVEHHRAQRRSFERDESLDVRASAGAQVADQQPGASELIAADEQAEMLYSQLTPDQACAVQLRLENYTVPEIAASLNCTDRTVRRWLHTARRLVEAQLAASDQAATSLDQPRPIDDELTFSLDHRDFLLQHHLGSGGMGRVYSAIEKRTGRAYAFKTIRKSLISDPLALRRFRLEAKALAQLQHPGIVVLRGLGHLPSGAYFFLMDLVDGQSLGDSPLVQQLETTRIAEIVAGVADAIEFAHSRGIIHCDLKPANVLVDADQRIFVSDFGLACFLSASEQPQVVGGTAGFMAPEQIDPAWGTIGPRTDVFGLGGLLYFLLSRGQSPNQGADRESILQAARADEPIRPLNFWRSDVSAEAAEIAMKALAKQPERRFASAAEFAIALRLWLKALPNRPGMQSSDPATSPAGRQP